MDGMVSREYRFQLTHATASPIALNASVIDSDS
jgi:hypothetical protein